MKLLMYQTAEEGIYRRLSLWRLLILFGCIVGVLCGGLYGLQQWQDKKTITKHQAWFGAYVDVTATPTFAFEQLGATTTPHVVLAFVVASSSNGCTPSWGNIYTLDQANLGIDLDRRIARLRQQGGDVAVSFGGERNNELAVTCPDTQQLFAAYQSVIDRYTIDTIDLDLEGNGLTDKEAIQRRAVVIAKLQKEQRAKKKYLAIWLTLPVTPQGLNEDGTSAISQMLTRGVDITGVNVMTMDYGQSKSSQESMEKTSEDALLEVHRQLGILYKESGINLSNASLWTKIGATPMIGQNDSKDEIFNVTDAAALNSFALAENMGRISIWSANRDIQCGENYVDTKIVSDSCSGTKEDKFAFSTTLSKGFGGDFSHNAALVTTQDATSTVEQSDDPEKSPYQIWKETGAYLQGTKVVWHRNVYEAKWWTQGDVPDNPVLQSWQTPWQLVGPVLPGEKPIPQPTLPLGTYPVWSGATEYDTNQRVLFNGIPYQAKWWNKGESPAAATSNADSSPWAPLTQQQLEEIIVQLNASRSARVNTKIKKL